MRNQLREFRYFFFTQEFADGLRTTIAILLPSLILYFFGQLHIGTTISLGALCVNFADAPGPVIHKRNGMFFSILFMFISALLTGFVHTNVYALGLEILLCSFLFSMFTVYGARATAVGSGALLVLILTMDQPNHGYGILWQALFIVAGGLWYAGISLLFYNISPYRPAQRALGKCIRELAKYLRIKAKFYNTNADLEKAYQELFSQQVVVSEKQESVRELFFKSRQIVGEPSFTGHTLILTFVDVMDMFEEVTATYYDYPSLHQRFQKYHILSDINKFIHSIANELDAIGLAILANHPYRKGVNFEQEFDALKVQIDKISEEEKGISNIVLKKILVNIRRLVLRINDISNYFEPATHKSERVKNIDFQRFVSHQSFDAKLFWDNMNLNSSIFRHSIRVAIACLIGFTISKVFHYGQHSYWIVLTIAFILKPAYSLTKQRNIERIIGTVIGGMIAILILAFIPNTNILFALMVVFMLGTYSTQRTNYIAMVLFVTPFVLILFKLMGLRFIAVARERILDTVIGCAIAFPISYLLFPKWEAEDFKDHIRKMLQANIDYLLTVAKKFSGEVMKTTDFKLARKEVYIQSANLSAAFQRMLSEPKGKQKNKKISTSL
ncbi:FUSC family protein [Flavisolibacter tropicus]|uniref:FUSC family protein n=1 Tax=Flavisolibacter tropicus TaxID=1492898 RepID=UPI0009ECF4AC|nr:FUSC family membrane protein [Flavisolibacter tropicus]